MPQGFFQMKRFEFVEWMQGTTICPFLVGVGFLERLKSLLAKGCGVLKIY